MYIIVADTTYEYIRFTFGLQGWGSLLVLNTTSKVKSKNNALELRVFRYLNQNKIYYRKHYSRVPGSPDIALPRKKRAVFINGDFWHGHNFGRRKLQLSNYWLNKIQRNMARDEKILSDLRISGWKCLIVWESDLVRKRTSDQTLERIADFLRA